MVKQRSKRWAECLGPSDLNLVEVKAYHRYMSHRGATIRGGLDLCERCAESDRQHQWILHVQGKGGKRRSIPLPSVCVPALRAYRLARALPERPSPFERIALIHSEKRDALGHSGLYNEVKAVLLALATLTLLRAASTHWLRHGYARAGGGSRGAAAGCADAAGARVGADDGRVRAHGPDADAGVCRGEFSANKIAAALAAGRCGPDV
jgi:hypothetical protein